MNTRRHFLTASALLAAPLQLTLAQTARSAAPDDARFVFVLLRGGMDGLARACAKPAPWATTARLKAVRWR